MIYLASPYSHPEQHIRTRRYIQARDFVHSELLKGKAIFSPIVYGHQFAMTHGMPVDEKTWRFLNDSAITLCSEFWVLRIDGWDKSQGVLREIELALILHRDLLEVEPLPYANF